MSASLTSPLLTRGGCRVCPQPPLQRSFSLQWVIGYVMDNTAQWKEIVKTAIQAAIILYLMDRFRLISDLDWFESHIDTLSVMATMAQNQMVGWTERTIAYMKYTARIG